MTVDYLPSSDSGLLGWAQNFSTRIVANPSSYGLAAPQVQSFNDKLADYAAKFKEATEPATRTSPGIIAKNQAKKALVAESRQLVRIIQAYPAITDEQRRKLEITIPKSEPTPVPVPAAAPEMDIVSVVGRVVKVRLHATGGSARRAKPAGVQGAVFFSHVGPTPPVNLHEWTFQGDVTRTSAEITFNNDTPPFSQVWLTAAWYNPRGERGPTCPPISTDLGKWSAQAA